MPLGGIILEGKGEKWNVGDGVRKGNEKQRKNIQNGKRKWKLKEVEEGNSLHS